MRRTILASAVTTLLLTGCSSDDPIAPRPAAPYRLAPSQSSAASGAPVIIRIPEDSPGTPFYSDLTRGGFVTDGEWAAISFYHPTSCIPADFNLLDWLDFAAAGCETAIAAKFWWHDPSTDPFPFQEQYDGLGAVPVYFVRVSELAAAIADDNLTIGELNALPSLLVGSASDFKIQVLNSNQGNRHANSTLVARGELEDGRSFQFHLHEEFFPATGERVFTNVKIAFK